MPRPRLWPAVLVLLLGALWIARIWLTGDSIRQWRMVGTIATSLVVVALLVAWLAFFSRLSRRARLVGLAVAAAVLALVPAFFRIRGVTGDLRPIVEPRFGRAAVLPEPEALPEPRSRFPLPSLPRPAPRRAPARASHPCPRRRPASEARSSRSRRRSPVPRPLAGRDARRAAPRARLDEAPAAAAVASAAGPGLGGLRDLGPSRRDAGAARRRGARGGVRRHERPAALVARRPRPLRDGDRGRRPARDAHARRLARVRDGRHRDPERARPREREAAVVARRREGDGRRDPGLGPELLAARRGRPRRGDRGRLRGPPAGGLRRGEAASSRGPRARAARATARPRS